MIVARWNDTVTLDYDGMFANAFFDFYNQAHQYWIFRPGSSIDTVNGWISEAFFSQVGGRNSFGPTTDPHPYLTDGTPETSFEITDIYDHGDHLTFHVHFFDTGIEDYQLAGNVRIYPNPATDVVNVQCTMNNEQLGDELQLFDVYGKLLQIVPITSETTPINVADLASGIYFVRVTTDQGIATKRFVKN